MPMRLSTMKTHTAVLAAALLLTSCSGGGSKAISATGIEFRPIGGDVFAVTIGPDADVPKTEAALRKHCEGKQACTIYGWTDAAAAARSEPLTDPQTAALAVRYTHNATGRDDMEWDCIRFRAAKAPCLIKA